VWVEETGLSYNLNRYYDGQAGRYVQADPIGLEGGWNRFGYVGGNPLLLVDPAGLSAADITIMLDLLKKEFPDFRPRGAWRFGTPSQGNIAETAPLSGLMTFPKVWETPGCLSSDEFYSRIGFVFHEGMHSSEPRYKRILDSFSDHPVSDPIWSRHRWEFGSLPSKARIRTPNMWGNPRPEPVDADDLYKRYLNMSPDCNCRAGR